MTQEFRYRPWYEYDYIAWNDRAITKLDQEDLLEALFHANRRIKQLKEDRAALENQIEEARRALEEIIKDVKESMK